MIASSYIIVTFIKFPKARKTPGDYILAISISTFIQSLHFQLNAYYSIIYNLAPPDRSLFCQLDGFISIGSACSIYLYNFIYALSPIIIITKTLKSRFSKFKYN